MKLIYFILGICFATAGISQPVAFTPGNLAIVRVGSPDSALPTSSSPVFLEEYSPSGLLVQSIPFPLSGDRKLTLSGRSTTEGQLRLSGNGAFLTLGGYNLVPGTSSVSTNTTAANRSIARINTQGQVDIPVILPIDQLYPNASFRGVVAEDENNGYWTAGGTRGVYFVKEGVDTSVIVCSTVTNMRGINLFAGQLYLTHGSGVVNTRVMKVGEGTPDTNGVEAIPLPGIPFNNAAGSDLFFADILPEQEGPEMMYLADELNGITKYSLVEGTWISNGSLGPSSDNYRGLTGAWFGSGALMYASRKGGSGSAGGGELVRVIDKAGYNQPIDPVVDILAVAEPNTAFRGIAKVPAANVLNQKVYVFNGNGGWENAANWLNGEIPDGELLPGTTILILPATGGVCNINSTVTIPQKVSLIVPTGTQLNVNGDLNIQDES